MHDLTIKGVLSGILLIIFHCYLNLIDDNLYTLAAMQLKREQLLFGAAN